MVHHPEKSVFGVKLALFTLTSWELINAAGVLPQTLLTHSLNYRKQNSSPRKPDTWIGSSGKLLNLKCTNTISTEKMA
jgi:hypothetical protein